MSHHSDMILAAKPKLASKTAKAHMKTALEKGQTKAKTAQTPASKQKLAERIKAAQHTKARLSSPGEWARCRALMGGDWRAGELLYRIAHLWRAINPKMKRGSKEMLAMSREDWAMSAGLSGSELKNYALPILRKFGHAFVEVHAIGRGSDKKVAVEFDPLSFEAAKAGATYEMMVAASDGQVPFE